MKKTQVSLVIEGGLERESLKQTVSLQCRTVSSLKSCPVVRCCVLYVPLELLSACHPQKADLKKDTINHVRNKRWLLITDPSPSGGIF